MIVSGYLDNYDINIIFRMLISIAMAYIVIWFANLIIKQYRKYKGGGNCLES